MLVVAREASLYKDCDFLSGRCERKFPTSDVWPMSAALQPGLGKRIAHSQGTAWGSFDGWWAKKLANAARAAASRFVSIYLDLNDLPLDSGTAPRTVAPGGSALEIPVKAKAPDGCSPRLKWLFSC
jgi:hypothetical protein